jgi:ribonuclease BN (tRNA processing enzyme)
MTPAAKRLVVTILGSGTCVPSLSRSACSVLVEAGQTRILLDLGPGTMGRLLAAGYEIFDISAVALSHFHPDHSGELAPFLFATRYPDQGRRKTPLPLVGGPGISDFFRRLQGVYGHWIDPPAGLEIVEIDGQGPRQRTLGAAHLAIATVVHNPESLAYRVTLPGAGSVVYSGDTDFSDNLVALAAGADLFICESAFPDGSRVPGHLTPSLAGEMARRAGVKKLVLTHFYPDCDAVDLTAQCRRTWQGPLVLARDLMRIELG